MNFQLSSTGKVKYCPSVTCIVDGSTYIIGCYQLIAEGDETSLSDDQLITINRRLGCLVLIESSKIKFEYDCLDGGVFDLAVVKPDDFAECLTHQCWAAHSNGTIACYDLINGTIKLNKRILTDCSMLCSLTVCGGLVAAGDSESKLIAVEKDEIVAKYKLNSTPSGDPVWCLKIIPHDCDNYIIISGSEDAKLRFNVFHSGSFSRSLKEVKDFTAGVTSIALIGKPDTCDQKDDEKFDYVLYVGSYDETMRIYYLNICKEQVSTTLASIQLVSIQTIHINGSGIWKIIPIKCNETWPYMLIAGMYAGACIVQKFTKLSEIKLDSYTHDYETAKLALKNEPDKLDHLVYGVAGLNNCGEIIVTSFYDKSFHFFTRCK